MVYDLTHLVVPSLSTEPHEVFLLNLKVNLKSFLPFWPSSFHNSPEYIDKIYFHKKSIDFYNVKVIIDRPIGEFEQYADLYGEPQLCFSAAEMDSLIKSCTDDVIEVELRSPGGSVEQGLMIYDLLRNSGKSIKMKGYQLHSVASIIFLAGDERLISSNATPILHHPALLPWDLDGRLTASDLELIAETIKVLEDRMMAIYRERMGFDAENEAVFVAKLQEEWRMSADDAIMWNLATGKIEYSGGQAKVKPLAYSDKAVAIYKETQLNMDIKQQLEELKGLIKAAFAPKVKAGSVTTTSETVSVLYFEGDQLEAGKAVFSDEAMETAAPAGEYELDGGMKILVETNEGVSTVTSITEAEDEDTEALKKELADAKATIEAMNKEKAEAEAKAAAQAEAIRAISAKVEAFEKLIPGDGDPSKREISRKEVERENKKTQIFGR